MLQGQISPHPVVVTIGKQSTFAYIGTDEGSFEMVGNLEFGWLMPTASMERHVDYSLSDYVIPNLQHTHAE